MTGVIEFLEAVASNAALQGATKDELQEVLERTSIEPSIQAAILANDRAVLQSATNSRVIAHKVITFPWSKDDEDQKDDIEIPDQQAGSNRQVTVGALTFA